MIDQEDAKVAEFNENNPLVGQTLTYPSPMKWRRVIKISKEIAWVLVATMLPPDTCLMPDHKISNEMEQPVQTRHGWLNKLAVVITVNYDNVVALCLHDFDFWVIEFTDGPRRAEEHKSDRLILNLCREDDGFIW